MELLLLILGTIGIALIGLILAGATVWYLFFTLVDDGLHALGNGPGQLLGQLRDLGLYVRTRFKRF